MLRQIKPRRMPDQVFEQLKDLIFRGQFKPGERLMAERELARSLGVGRPTVRGRSIRYISFVMSHCKEWGSG
ncbi:MAG: GntR family transcriptional regulator [Syntrophobacteraceae bacterium]|jgi:GntR family transcriptional repressor for pyruvate dehydrogenase complex|nr:GntR family transcriptional regulator [Syntrophobacteraceae bacterium]